MSKKILIFHYRVGGTDGVSLEIEKRKKILTKMGYKVKLCAGDFNSYADIQLPDLEFSKKKFLKIKENAFFQLKDFSEQELKNEIESSATKISTQLKKLISKEKPNYLMLHNIFSHGRHISTAKAFYDVIKESNILTIVTHHDIWWERDIYQKPTCNYIKSFLKKYVPPKLRNLKHVVINKLAKKKFQKRYNMDALVIPDTFDFNMPIWKKDYYNKNFLTDTKIGQNKLIFLQATRIVPRKGIELAVDFVTKFQKIYDDQFGKPTLVLAGYPEKDGIEYLQKIKQKAKRQKIDLIVISNQIAAKRKLINKKKLYSLWDCYVFADIVTYPSLWEGWGNQFIEAVFAKKPIIVFEYPVFRSDIKPEKYQVISLGDKYKLDKNKLAIISEDKLAKSAQELGKILINKNMIKKITEHNFRIGKKFHSFKQLKKLLSTCLKKAS